MYGELRLVNSENNHINVSLGLLEVFINEVWGTVCNHGFDYYDADVACRQLGFLGAATFNSAQHIGYLLTLS